MDTEVIDLILYAISALVGWFTRWLQGRRKVMKLTKENDYLLLLISQLEKTRP